MRQIIEIGISPGLDFKSKARIRAINFFGFFLLLVSIFYGVFFYIIDVPLLTLSFVGLVFVIALPVFLNHIKKYRTARIIYIFLTPFNVIFFYFLIEQNLDLQIFLVMMYGFAFIFLTIEEKGIMVLFFVYNTILLLSAVFFNFQPFEAISLAPQLVIPLKVTAYLICVFMGGTMFYFFSSSIADTEKTLIESKNKVELANKMKQEFLANMSHEIRTPLYTVITSANLIKEKYKEDNEGLAETLHQSSKQLFNLVNDILEFNKIESKNIRINEVPLNFPELMISTTSAFFADAREKGLKYKVNLDESIDTWLKVDQIRIVQILNNLISNAVKFTEQGEININIRLVENQEDHQVIKFEVQDTGIGIRALDQAFIFESFTQAYMASDRKFGGVGLGLTIVKNLVQLYGSELELQSELGVGTTFGFQLRLPKSETVIEEKDTAEDILRKLEVLIVEDYEVNALLIKKVLQKWNIQADLAKNGFEAVDKAKDKKYDLILMDIHMPEMNGLEATQIIKSDQKITNYCTPIHALTADVTIYEDQSDYNQFDGVLVKPVEPNQLLNVLKTL